MINNSYTGNKTDTPDFLKVLLTLKQNIMKDLNVAEVCKVLEIKDNNITVVSINNNNLKIKCIKLEGLDVYKDDLVYVSFNNSDFRLNYNKFKNNQVLQNINNELLHSLNYGIIIGSFSRAGEQGPKGDKGDPGITPDISTKAITLSPGSQATATISGPIETPTITFGIPQGDPGTSGEIYQTTGTSTTGAMSQKATTDALNEIYNYPPIQFSKYEYNRSKNLFNINNIYFKYVEGTYSINRSTGVITFVDSQNNSTSDVALKTFADLEVGKTYLISFITTGANNYIYLNGSESVWNNGTAHTITQAELDAGIHMYGKIGETTTIKDIIIVEQGTDIDYQPYNGAILHKNDINTQVLSVLPVPTTFNYILLNDCSTLQEIINIIHEYPNLQYMGQVGNLEETNLKTLLGNPTGFVNYTRVVVQEISYANPLATSTSNPQLIVKLMAIGLYIGKLAEGYIFDDQKGYKWTGWKIIV